LSYVHFPSFFDVYPYFEIHLVVEVIQMFFANNTPAEFHYRAFEDDNMKAPMSDDSLKTHAFVDNEENPVFREEP